jgi:23S rRNA pseudouridine1911/1915/1917 synthase
VSAEEQRPEMDSFSRRACAWPRRLVQGPARLIAPEELRSWIIYEDESLFVVSKPGDVVCHPSKAGPWSSLVGAVREVTQLETVHLIFRLDRETSGVVVFAKNPKMARRLQMAMQERKVGKRYQAILTGALREVMTVDQPLGDDVASPVFVKSAVCEGGQRSVTHFMPEAVSRDAAFTLVNVVTGGMNKVSAALGGSAPKRLAAWIAGKLVARTRMDRLQS